MRRMRRILAILLIAGALLGVWAFWLEPSSLVVRDYRLQLPHWPQKLAGMRVAVLTDLHVGSPFNGLDKLAEIVDQTNEAAPDLVVLPGDFVIHGVAGGQFVPPDQLASVLAGLEAPLGVWAILGNHDWWLGFEQVKSAFEENGIPVLEDAAVTIKHGATTFWLVGIGDEWEGEPNIAGSLSQVTDESPVLAVTHNPDIFPDVPDRVSLLVAGHTHGGQVYLPLVGRPIVPSKFGERYAIGHVVEDGRHLFVSSGLGTSILPVRFLVAPEISILELHPVDSKSDSSLASTSADRPEALSNLSVLH